MTGITPNELNMIIPAALQTPANAIALALDFDVRGDLTFEVALSSDGETITHYGTHGWTSDIFKADLTAFLEGTENLQEAVELDYILRWPDKTPPTAQQIEDVRTSIIVEWDMDFSTAIGQNSLTII